MLDNYNFSLAFNMGRPWRMEKKRKVDFDSELKDMQKCESCILLAKMWEFYIFGIYFTEVNKKMKRLHNFGQYSKIKFRITEKLMTPILFASVF